MLHDTKIEVLNLTVHSLYCQCFSANDRRQFNLSCSRSDDSWLAGERNTVAQYPGGSSSQGSPLSFPVTAPWTPWPPSSRSSEPPGVDRDRNSRPPSPVPLASLLGTELISRQWHVDMTMMSGEGAVAPTEGEVTRLLGEWQTGLLGAGDRLIPPGLRRPAARSLRGPVHGGRALGPYPCEPTALVHEAYLLQALGPEDWRVEKVESLLGSCRAEAAKESH